jgi:hypothetical protein
MLKLPSIPNLSLSEKDIFVIIFGVFILVCKFLNFSVSPFRLESLIVVFLFLLTTRGIVESIKFFPYLMIAVIGLVLSTFLSPYGLLIFYIVALVIYKKTNLL